MSHYYHIFKLISFYLKSFMAKFYSIVNYNNINKVVGDNSKCVIVIVTILLLFMMIRMVQKKHKINKNTSAQNFNTIVKEIHYATCYCKDNPYLIPRCIELITKYPESCNIPFPNHNYTPFLRACWNGCPELILHMIRKGADTSATTDAGEGGIYLATYCVIRRNENSFKALEILIVGGLDINLARHDGFSPLHLAASRGHSRLVRWLLANGANPEPKGRPTAAYIAVVAGYPQLASILRLPSIREYSPI